MVAPDELSEQDRTVEQIRNSASALLQSFKSKLNSIKGNYEVNEKLLRQGIDKEKCFQDAKEFFGKEQVRYLAIDGTEFQDERLDMLIFYAGAFAYGGEVRFTPTEGVIAEAPKSNEDTFSLSSAIPLSDEYASAVTGESTPGGVEVDTERVPSSLMRLAEYYLAYISLKNDPNLRILLMDRNVSGDIAHISWKMREHIEFPGCFLEGFETSRGQISKIDLELGRMLVAEDGLRVPAPRSQLLKFAAMKKLIDSSEPADASNISGSLGLEMNRDAEIVKELKRSFGDALIFATNNQISTTIEIRPSVKFFWERLLEATVDTAARIFNPSQTNHPLRIRKKVDEEGWLTTPDIDYLTLILIYAIVKEAWARNILLVGIIKDTAANELVRTVIPILEDAKLLNFKNELPRFESDKMLLQANSVMNSDRLASPWRTFEYDVCFRTISPEATKGLANGESKVRGAFKNVIASERMFVKAYFQLWSSPKDPNVRSFVFLYDRPCYPKYDVQEIPELVLKNKDIVEEKVIPTIHFVRDSSFGNLVIGVLYSMGTEAIPEALGHNYPLFLADKKAKWMEAEAQKACTAAVELEVNRSRLDQQMLYEDKFRDYREKVEGKRKSRNRRST